MQRRTSINIKENKVQVLSSKFQNHEKQNKKKGKRKSEEDALKLEAEKKRQELEEVALIIRINYLR